MINTIINYLNKHKICNIKKYERDILLVDFVLIGTGMSKKQINEVSLQLVKYIKNKYRLKRIAVCGKNTEWLIIDCDTEIVHLILDNVRLIYDIDDLYS